METLRRHWLKVAGFLALIGLLMVLAACAAQATPTPTPRPPTPTPTRVPPTPTPTPIPPTPTPLPPGATPLPATATPTPLPSTPTPTPKPPLFGPAPASTYSDEEWAKIVEAAKKEGKLMVYNWSFSALTWMGKAAREGMKEAYGIDIEFVGGRASVVVERIKTETRAGLHVADIFQGNPSLAAGSLDKPGYYKVIDNLPVFGNASDPDVWYYNPLLTPSVAQYAGSTSWSRAAGNYNINTRVVPPEREPKKWEDLLDPFWKQAKICLEDSLLGNTHDWAFLRNWRALGSPDWFVDYWYDLVRKGSGYAFYTIGGQPGGLNTAECGITIGSYQQGTGPPAVKQRVVIEKITWIKTGTWEPPVPMMQSGHLIGVLKTAPHPNAALVFVNYLFTYEGQYRMAMQEGTYTSLRRDVPDPVEKKYWPEKPVPTFWVQTVDHLLFEDYFFARRSFFRLTREGMSKEAWRKELRDSVTAFWGQYPPPPLPLMPVPEEGN